MTTFSKWEDNKRYRKQSDLIHQALSNEGHELNTLLSEMEASEDEGAVYLCGGRLDNDYCFGSKDLGLAISKLPKDGVKAGIPGHHPGSTEIYTIFQGKLTMEILDNKTLQTKSCGQFDVYVIPPGKCHRIVDEPDRIAASFIVKTNLWHDPGVVRCKKCTYYCNLSECPLRNNWLQEKKQQLTQNLEQLQEEMKRKVGELKENCPSKLYEDFDDPSSGLSEMIHTEATTSQVMSVQQDFQAQAKRIVKDWLHEDGCPELGLFAEELEKRFGF